MNADVTLASCDDVQKLFCAAEAAKTVHFFGNFRRHWLVKYSPIGVCREGS